MQNLYQIDHYRDRVRPRSPLQGCYCDANHYRDQVLARELTGHSLAILCLESLDEGVPANDTPDKPGWDLIYSADLLSDLPLAAARQVVRLAVSRLSPGGRLLLANIRFDSRVMPCNRCKDQPRNSRSELEMAELAHDLSADFITGQTIFQDARGLNIYLELYRSTTGGASS